MNLKERGLGAARTAAKANEKRLRFNESHLQLKFKRRHGLVHVGEILPQVLEKLAQFARREKQ